MSSTSLYGATAQSGTVSTTNLTSLYSNTGAFTTGTVTTAVNSVTGGTGVTVNPTTGNVVVSIGQPVGTANNVTFANVTATGNLSNSYYTLANAVGTNGQVLTTDGAGATAWTNVSGLGLVNSVTGSGAGISVSPTTGAVVVTNTGVTSITGTANQIIASSSTGAVTLSTPQNIATTSSPTFANQTLTGSLTLNGSTSGSVNLSVPAVAGSSSMIIPSGSSTLVARDTTDTLTNKTISGVNNTISGIGNASLVNSSITLGTTNIALGATSLTPAGLTSVTVTQDPVAALDLATKQYVDQVATTGLTFHAPVQAATTASLASITGGTVTYNQPGGPGVGVGATITLSVALTVLDGYTLLNTNRILVKDEVNQTYNGVYTWATGGTVLTRATDADTYGANPNQLSLNDYFFTQNGTVNKGIAYVLNAPAGTIIFGTSAITFAEFSSSQVYTATAPIAITGTVISLNTVPIASGGTGQITANAAINALLPSQSGNAGKVLSTDGTNTSWSTLPSAGVTSITGTANQIIASSSTGAVTLSTPQDIATTSSPTFANITTTGDIAVNGGDITTTAATFNLINTTATTLNMGATATAVNIGAATGTVAINNPALSMGNGSAIITLASRIRLTQLLFTTSAATPNQIVFTDSASNYRNVKFQFDVVSGSDRHSADITLTNNGTTSYITVANEMWTNVSLTDWDTSISGSNVRLLVSPTNAVTNYRAWITGII
jgi:hypothetical protein